MVSLGLLIVRLVAGGVVAAHGAQKLCGAFDGPGLNGFAGWLRSMGLRPAYPLAVAAALAEFAGGLAFALGLLTPLAAWSVAAVMLMAIVTVHWQKGFFAAKGGIEFPLLIMATVLGTSLAGPGRYTLDALLGLGLPEPITWLATGAISVGTIAVALLTRRTHTAARPPNL